MLALKPFDHHVLIQLPHYSRQAIKKYVSSNNKINVASQATFDAQFNKAIKAGVEKGEFLQPKGKCQLISGDSLRVFLVINSLSHRVDVFILAISHGDSRLCFDDRLLTRSTKGPSGPVKLAKKEAAPKPAAKPAAKKATTAKVIHLISLAQIFLRL